MRSSFRFRSPKFWIIVGLGVLFLALAVWLFVWPIEHVPLWRLVPSEAFFMASFDLSSQGMSGIIGKLEEAIVGLVPSWKGFFLKVSFPFLLPNRITMSHRPNAIIVEMGRRIRAVKPLIGLSGFPLAYRTFGGSILLARSSSLLEEVAGSRGPSRWTRMGGSFGRLEGRDCFFVVDNGDGALSEFVRSMEERYEFAAFPSVDAVSVVAGYVDFEGEDFGRGRISFFCKDGNSDRLRSDVRFIYGAIRRKLRPYGVGLKGRVETEPGAVSLDFKVEGVADAVVRVLSSRISSGR